MSRIRLAAAAGLCLLLAAPASAGVVAAGGENGVLRTYDLSAGTPLWSVPLVSEVYGIEIASDDAILVGTRDEVLLYDSQGNLLAYVPLGVLGGNYFIPDDHPVAIAVDGNVFAAAHSDDTIRVYDRTGALLMSSPLPGVHTLDLSADGRALLAGGAVVRLYQAGPDGWGAADATPAFEDPLAPRIVSLADSGLFGVAGDWSSTAHVYGVGGVVLSLTTLGSIVTAGISADGRTVALGNDDPGDFLGAQLDLYRDGGNGWDASDGTPACVYDATPYGTDDIRAVALSDDGSTIAMGGAAGYGGTRIIDGSCTLLTTSTVWYGNLGLGMTSDGRFTAGVGLEHVWVNVPGVDDPLWHVTVPGEYFNAVATSRCASLLQSCEAVAMAVDAACPCEAAPDGVAWKNHGQYISCVTHAYDREMLRSMKCLAQPVERVVLGQCIVSPRARTDCGKP